DNQNFEDVTSKFGVEVEKLPARTVVRVSSLPEHVLRAHYWKIHFANGQRSGTFAAPETRQFLAVYEEGAQRR
ncbi:MAG: hypothetical protein KDD64_13580, partial [Bdellovibrionales bacterium]|nr:hypothetical protein [Bdellovibrionales bacterium]